MQEYNYLETETGELWDEMSETSREMPIIFRSADVEQYDLPALEGYQSGFAGQTFNINGGHKYPTWISGRLELPPHAVKQAESVGTCTQVSNP